MEPSDSSKRRRAEVPASALFSSPQFNRLQTPLRTDRSFTFASPSFANRGSVRGAPLPPPGSAEDDIQRKHEGARVTERLSTGGVSSPSIIRGEEMGRDVPQMGVLCRATTVPEVSISEVSASHLWCTRHPLGCVRAHVKTVHGLIRFPGGGGGGGKL